MDKKLDLAELKQKYNAFQEKYNLPSFEKLNEDFQVEKAAEAETDFILREIRRHITDKFFNYLRFIESILTPNDVPMFVFAIAKTLGAKEKEKLIELYKKIAKVDVDLIELDLQYSEEKEVQSIKDYYEIWQDIKKDLLSVVEVIKKNWDVKVRREWKRLFGIDNSIS
jgi:hypothetical protein